MSNIDLTLAPNKRKSSTKAPRRSLRKSLRDLGLDKVRHEEQEHVSEKPSTLSTTTQHLAYWRRSLTYEEAVTDQRIVLNVGGVHHETLVSTLASVPGTRLAKLAARHDNTRIVYFFDRHYRTFVTILDYYRTGELHIPLNICGVVFKHELRYWQIDYNIIEPCCWRAFSNYVDTQTDLDKNVKYIQTTNADVESRFVHSRGYTRFRLRMWRILNYPQTSIVAKVYISLLILFVLTSLVLLMLGTLPGWSVKVIIYLNQTTCPATNSYPPYFKQSAPTVDLVWTHQGLLLFFTFDWIARLAFAPTARAVLLSLVTYLDLLALLPEYMAEILSIQGCWIYVIHEVQAVVDVLVIFRVIRVLYLLHHFKPMAILMRSLRNSVYELGTLFVFVLSTVLIFGTLIYYSEKYTPHAEEGASPEQVVSNIPLGMWLSLTTLTSVGYGDVLPKTWLGRAFAGLCSALGVVMLSLTIPIISGNFTTLYTHIMSRDQALVRSKLTHRTASVAPAEETAATKKRPPPYDNSAMNSAVS